MHASAVMLFVVVVVAACGDETERRPIGATCDHPSQCESGHCVSSRCIDPAAVSLPSEPWGVIFSPYLDLGSCRAGLTWSSQVFTTDPQGGIDVIWAPNEPNTARLTGTLDAAEVTATLACLPSGSPSGSLTATRVGEHYEGSFTFAEGGGGESRGDLMMLPGGLDTVTVQGTVVSAGSGAPIAGALVRASVDTQSQTSSNAGGMFYLVTTAAARYSDTPYRLTISAAGHTTFDEDAVWGDHPQGQRFELTPSSP